MRVSGSRLALQLVLVCCVPVFSCLERGKDEPAETQVPVAKSSQAVAARDSKPAAQVVDIRAIEPKGPADPAARIRLRLVAEPLHLNPMLAGDTIAVGITLGDVYEALLHVDRPGAMPTAGLAVTHLRSADGKRWTFTLREGVRFHDGQLLTARDVQRSYALAKRAAGPLRADFDDLLAVKTPSASTLVFEFATAKPARGEAFAAVPIVAAADFAGVDVDQLARAKASLAPNGTGPLRVVSWRAGQIDLERFDSYWGVPARSQHIRYRVLADEERALAELRAGRLDAVLRLPIASAISAYQVGSGLALVRESLPAYTAAVFNTERPALTLPMRQALSQSFDRQGIVKELFAEQVQVATGPFVVGSRRSDPTVQASNFSLPVVKAQLVRAGALEGSLRLLVPDSSTTMQRLADIWAEDVRGALRVDIERLPFAELLTRVRAGDFDVTLLSFTTSEAVDLFSLFHSSEIGSGNLARLRDAKLDAHLDELRTAEDGIEMRSLSQKLHRRLLHLAPFAFLTTDARLGLIRRELAGVGDSADKVGARYMWLAR